MAEIVAGCIDTFEDPKPPWAERKRRYLDHLVEPGVSESVLRVSLADKLHNARALLLDYRALGELVFEHFKTRSAADQLWYYRSLADIYQERLPGPMADELTRVSTSSSPRSGRRLPELGLGSRPGSVAWHASRRAGADLGRERSAVTDPRAGEQLLLLTRRPQVPRRTAVAVRPSPHVSR